jgi:hypothetical protein
MNDRSQNITRAIIQTILLLLIITYGISGLGITQFRIIEAVSFGLISKPLAFQLHDSLVIPFLVVLLLHIFFRPLARLLTKIKR